MPVEESRNMLILAAALTKLEGKADYALEYWPQLERWAAYLKDKGLDPENQLCTDDFAGHLAHNANLSVKAILGLRSFAALCEMAGKKADALAYKRLSEDFAKKWITMADDGDHYRLAFDKPGICVDVHVHRISNRLGYVRTRSPEDTERALRERLPRRYWIGYNDLLVAFGQNVCLPLSPRCSSCPVGGLCQRVNVLATILTSWRLRQSLRLCRRN